MKDIRILLCEDDPSLGRLLSDYLKAKGFEVTWAQDGVEGSRRFTATRTISLCWT